MRCFACLKIGGSYLPMKTKRKTAQPATLFGVVLGHLHTTAAPLLRFREIEHYLKTEPRRSLAKNVLVESQDRADEIPHPLRPDSGEFVGARKTSRGWFAVALDDDFFDPIPINERDVCQFLVSLPALVDALRQENGIAGEGSALDGNLIAVGQKVLEGFGTVDVYLALQNDDPSEFAARCRGIRRSHGAKRVAVFIPRPVALTNTQRQLLDSQAVLLIPLQPMADNGTLTLDWQSEVIAALAVATPDGFRAPRTVVWQGCEHRCDLTSKEQEFLVLAISEEQIEVPRVMHLGERPLWKRRFRNEKSQRDTISKFLSRLNRKLATAKPAVPLSFSLKRGSQSVQRRVLSISPASSR
jgi:hypothetical protein